MAAPMNIVGSLFLLILGAVSTLILIRFIVVFLSLGNKHSRSRHSKEAIKLLIVAGSGGHTSEILRLLGSLSDNYQPRIYVVADTDKMSLDKIREFESRKKTEHLVEVIPRSREVRQSYVTSIASTLYAACYAFPLVFRVKPDLVLVNGPGTCIPICAAAFILRVLGLKTVLQVYVESICRVKHLSLSGLIMYYFADKILVQWPQLVKKYPRAQYIGRVV